MLAYKERAKEVVERVTRQWEKGPEGDVKALTEAVYYALVEEANLELRQILAQMGGQLEMALHKSSNGQAPLSNEKIRNLIDGVNRSSEIMEIFLDRSAAAKLTIRLAPEAFDLCDAVKDLLRAHGIESKLQIALQASPVLADRTKLMDAIGHLVTRFYFAARTHESVIISVSPKGDGLIEGFIGLAPSHLSASQLMEEMHMPLNVEDVGIEVAYIRAVLERHGGTLFVATAGDTSAGFGFTLPSREEDKQ